ncbi:MAG: rhomboid family intramembrane serine protease [Lachnospiraceae bacterium]|nr:rhomboid family intramembrane serine protease [Lachnospiraceae bacterium]
MEYRRLEAAEPKEAAAVLILMGINALLFLLCYKAGGEGGGIDGQTMLRYGAMLTSKVEDGEYWRYLSSMFLHFDLEHLVGNMLALFVIGAILEKGLGHIRTVVIYLLSGFGANVCSQLWSVHLREEVLSAGASGAIFGLMGALIFAALFDREKIGALSPLQIIVLLVLTLYHGVGAAVDDAAHLSGVVIGFILAAIFKGLRREPKKDPYQYW